MRAKIDKSALAIGEPRRIRSKAHLQFVATMPCVVCGLRPVQVHHLKMMQPRARGLKVGDQFTVPLCQGHHRLVEAASGYEAFWWACQHVDVEVAMRSLWERGPGK
ncbi:hypothetical protein LCGC14_2360680 [marine sediment metagenome]|uniref:DUF968 domain-containing protein n=1 Tax=marine sediment metagenome TaxID=412755 RepID=A0A0F9C6X3_9ZZZZ